MASITGSVGEEPTLENGLKGSGDHKCSCGRREWDIEDVQQPLPKEQTENHRPRHPHYHLGANASDAWNEIQQLVFARRLGGCWQRDERLRLHLWNMVSSTIAEMICPIRIWHSWMREVSLDGAQIQ